MASGDIDRGAHYADNLSRGVAHGTEAEIVVADLPAGGLIAYIFFVDRFTRQHPAVVLFTDPGHRGYLVRYAVTKLPRISPREADVLGVDAQHLHFSVVQDDAHRGAVYHRFKEGTLRF